jgi:hypothetical protein
MSLQRVPLLTEQQVSEKYGLRLSKLRQDRFNDRGMPYMKIGKLIRYSQPMIEKYLNSCLVFPKG